MLEFEFIKVKRKRIEYTSLTGYNPDVGDSYLFPELLKFNFSTQKWSKVFTTKLEKMPKESVSNALTLLKDDSLVVWMSGQSDRGPCDLINNDKFKQFPFVISVIRWNWISIR